MSKFRFSPLLFRRIHKWVGLILGLQFLLWTLSGSVMALLDKDKVRAHASHDMAAHGHMLPPGDYFDPAKLAERGPVLGVSLVDLMGRPVYEVRGPKGIKLVDATDGSDAIVDQDVATFVALMMHDAPVRDVQAMARPNLETRTHQGPMWRVNFNDEENSSAYVSAQTGRFLELRTDAYRTWDFFWMLHNMDYANRASFNHPLIIFVAFGTLWLSITGFYLLFKSFNKNDFRWLRRRKKLVVRRVS